MNDFDQVLDDCLGQIASGASSLDECLARHPEYSARLRPLLQTAGRLERGRELQPSPAFKARGRAQLTTYMQAHPRHVKRPLPPFWRAAISLATLAMAFVVTGTAFAQNALPGQPLYGWKLSSEQAWRAVAPDPVSVDLHLADRRTDELRAVAPNADREAQASNGYREVLSRLETESDAHNSERIMERLRSHQEKLSAAGITIPELNVYLSPSSSAPAPASPAPPDLSPTAVPTTAPKSMPAAVPTAVPAIIPPIIVATVIPDLQP